MAAPAIPVPRTAEHRASRGLWRDAFRRLLRNGPAVVGLVLISIFVLAAVFAPVDRAVRAAAGPPVRPPAGAQRRST